MCGILAIKGKLSLSDDTVSKMLGTLSHRGPDEQKFIKIKDAILGQARLSIVDLSAGNQPMTDNSKSITIVFNGEIYDYQNLKKDLEDKGHVFRTKSDTEVILKSYIEYGEDCVKYIDGMFAFVIYDQEKDLFFFARDRFGKKPFYYTFIDNTFICASEIKAIIASQKIKGQINPQAIHDYLKYSYIGPDKTIYKNISTLPPAHAGILENGKLKTWQFWSLKKQKIEMSYEQAKEQIKKIFTNAVRKRMIADVEIGSLLSGGVDSTITTYYAQKYSARPIKTFSIGYDGEKNELPYAIQASKKIGTDHYSLPINSDMSQALIDIISYMDEPHGDNSDFPQYLISKLASSKVKVALTGDGADELFMGYGWYQKKMHTPKWRLDKLFKNSFTIQQEMIRMFSDQEIAKLVKIPCSKNENYLKSIVNTVSDPIDKINNFDILFYLPGQLLTKIDRTSMMSSLEVRSPFLDTELVEYVYNLSNNFKFSKNQNKIILKEILAEIFPKDFVYRRKQGFGAPVKDWLKQNSITNLINLELVNKQSQIYQYLDYNFIQNIISDFAQNKRNSEHRLWIILCLAIWIDEHKENIE
jgi:asparagine synthase (glutamine-hydrolysing)